MKSRRVPTSGPRSGAQRTTLCLLECGLGFLRKLSATH
ncbi:hypothetical protein F443_22535 [Phytophthora nicotianae P1569]|uniref:Uncharacterized protein n=1 Tax=Phytophthora nicotianae P1569 TaxID=1317065 RepID=V9DUN8_PHYNI|nr:hypothetical protein F443_22535 [Phytophthora nicotianae P1569]